MGNILEDIVQQTADDLKKRRRRISMHDLGSMEDFERPRRDFGAALRGEEGKPVSIIAEIKKASPSKGLIRPDFDPVAVAEAYREGGASALSVLTDEPAFQGRLEHLSRVSRAVDLPALRKDFLIDPYQVKEARAYGADAVLVIVGITGEGQLDELLQAAEEFGLQCLVECYTEDELKRVPWDRVPILGVNNRDLRTFEVDLHRGIRLLQTAPEGTLLVSESGLGTVEDLRLLQQEGIHAALIGEHFMRQPDPGKAVARLLRF